MTEPEFPDSAHMDPDLIEELPGRYLSGTREARGLSIADIARTLKFSERQIEALERDDYQQLPGVTFIRGFIRSYARLLKLDPIPLLEMLDAGAPFAAVEVVAPGNMGDAVPRALLRRYAKGIVGGVILVGVFATLYLWAQGLLDEPGKAPPPLKPVPMAATAVAPPVVSTSPPSSPAPSAATNQAAGHSLVFDFDDKSWIEVKDATSSVVLTGEFPAHSHQVVSGPGPFQLWIGNAAAVRVTQDDKPIDLVPHAREGVARLTLD